MVQAETRPPERRAALTRLRKEPPFTFRDRNSSYRAQFTERSGKRSHPVLRLPDGSPVFDASDVPAAMARYVQKRIEAGKLDRDAQVARYYLGGGAVVIEFPEISAVLDDEIKSWRRTVHHAAPVNARLLLRRAATDLYRLVLVEPQAKRDYARSIVADELMNLARFHKIDDDDAQYIFAEATNESGSDKPRAEAPKSELIACRASEITPEKIEWIWPGRIARGKHTAIAGDPGAGKSQVMIAIAAAVTAGRDFPCGEGHAPGLGNVIILAAEDGVADTTVPRLHSAGANLERVHIIQGVARGEGMRMFSLQDDLDHLRKKIIEVGNVQLIGIDPVSSYLGRGIDSHKNAEIRAVLEPLGRLAEETRAAVVSVSHFSKGAGRGASKALYRFIGSLAFVAAPRIAFAVVEDPEDRERRLVLHVKNNLAKPPQGLAFRLEQRMLGDGILASNVVWDGQPVSMTADQAIGSEGNGEPKAKDDAIGFLQDALAGGAVAVHELEQSARDAGYLRPEQSISQSKPFRSARQDLGIKPFQRAGIRSGGWFWALPGQMP